MSAISVPFTNQQNYTTLRLITLWFLMVFKMASGDITGSDDSLYPIAVLIDELRNEDVQVNVI
jgi:hypothetical protein